MFTVFVLAAALAGVSALHPEMRLLSDGMRQTVEVLRILQVPALDAATQAAMAKCVTALVPPSITSFYTCIGVDLALMASGDENARTAAFAAMVNLQSEADGFQSSTSFSASKESCTALFKTTTFKCMPIMFASDPAAYIKANPFPTSVATLPAGCADLKTIVSQNAQVSAACTASLTDPTVKSGSDRLTATCGGQTPDGKNAFAELKKLIATIYNECAKTGADPAAGLSATDAAAVKAAMGSNAAGLVASVVLAAAAVVVAL